MLKNNSASTSGANALYCARQEVVNLSFYILTVGIFSSLLILTRRSYSTPDPQNTSVIPAPSFQKQWVGDPFPKATGNYCTLMHRSSSNIRTIFTHPYRITNSNYAKLVEENINTWCWKYFHGNKYFQENIAGRCFPKYIFIQLWAI